MPELPEVETIKRGLGRLLLGLQVASVNFDYPKGFPNSEADIEAFLIGASVTTVRRRAKVLIIELNSGYSLVTHLKMTGQMVFRGKESFAGGHPNDSLIGRLPDKSTRVTFSFASGDKLFFNDQRKFGWIRLLPTSEIANIDFMKRVGPEPLEAGFTWQVFETGLLRRKNTTIKAAILDQSVLAGVGNIYADESLWSAKIHPATLVRNVTEAKIKLLHGAIREVLELSIARGGSTDRNYVDAEGRRGSYLDFAKVFRREGQPCPRHPDTLIEKIRIAGRGTHICPKCQKVVQ